MNVILRMICRVGRSISSRWYHFVYMPFLLSEAKRCGNDVVIGPKNTIAGMDNMEFGNHVNIGPGAVLYSTKARLIFGNFVMCGPGLTVVTGEHRTDVVGEYMKNLSDDEKLPENDKDVVIEDDVWIGSNVTILKGVTVGRGSIIHAGAVVTTSIKPYTIYIREDYQVARFSNHDILDHERILAEKYGIKYPTFQRKKDTYFIKRPKS